MTPNHSAEVKAYFEANKSKYNFATVEGCGRYTEDVMREVLRPLDTNWGLLAYTGSGTKYNGHRIDSILYRIPDTGDIKLRSIDIITNAESDHASSGWGPDSQARYSDPPDWIAEPGVITSNTVPYQPYQGDASNAELKRQLVYDYTRRPQGADWDISVWAFRVQHSALMGPTSPSLGGKPLGMDNALLKHRPEWCEALHVPVVPIPTNWKIGDPV